MDEQANDQTGELPQLEPEAGRHAVARSAAEEETGNTIDVVELWEWSI